MGDFKFGKKSLFIRIVTLLFLANAVFYVYTQLDGRSITAMREVSKMFSEQIVENQERNYQFWLKELTSDELVDLSRFHGNPEGFREFIKQQEQQVMIKGLLVELLEHLTTFREQYTVVYENAQRMKNVELFSEPNSFSQRNIEITVNDYQSSNLVQLELVNGRSLVSFINYGYTDYIVVFVVAIYIFITVCPFTAKMKYLVFSTKNGRLRYGLRQMFSIGGHVLGITALFYGSIVLLSFFLYGIPHDFSASVQSIPEFRSFTGLYSIGKVFLQIFVIKFMVLYGFACFSASIIQLLENVKLSVTIIAGISLLQYVFSNAQIISFPWNMTKNFNLWTWLDCSEYYLQYNNINVFNNPVALLSFTIFASYGIMCITAISFTIAYCCIYPIRFQNQFWKRWLDRLPKRNHSIGYYELYKVLWVQKGIWIIAVFVLWTFIEFSTLPVQFSTEESYLNYLYFQYGGTPEKEKVSELEDLKAQLQMKSQETTVTQMQLMYEQQLLAIDSFIDNYKECVSYAESGINAGIVNPIGVEKLMFKTNTKMHVYSLVKACIMIILLMMQMMSIERKCGVNKLIHLTYEGERRQIRTKSYICLGVFVFTCILFFGVEWIQVLYKYSIGDLQYSIYSLDNYRDCWINIPLWLYLSIEYIIKCMGVGLIMILMICNNGQRYIKNDK